MEVDVSVAVTERLDSSEMREEKINVELSSPSPRRHRFFDMSDPSEALAALEEELAEAAAASAASEGGGRGNDDSLRCGVLGELLEQECAMHAAATVSYVACLNTNCHC